MKIWETDGRDVVLKGDTARLDKAKLNEFNRVAAMNAEIRRVIDEEWRENIIFWDKPSCLVESPEVHEWQCGTYGPEGAICVRVSNHVGRCSDFFSPADKKNLTIRLTLQKESELDEIVGKRPRSLSSHKLDVKKLRRMLED